MTEAIVDLLEAAGALGAHKPERDDLLGPREVDRLQSDDRARPRALGVDQADGRATPLRESETERKLGDCLIDDRSHALDELDGDDGFMLEYPISRASVDARLNPIPWRLHEIMLEIVGRSLGLGDPR